MRSEGHLGLTSRTARSEGHLGLASRMGQPTETQMPQRISRRAAAQFAPTHRGAAASSVAAQEDPAYVAAAQARASAVYQQQVAAAEAQAAAQARAAALKLHQEQVAAAQARAEAEARVAAEVRAAEARAAAKVQVAEAAREAAEARAVAAESLTEQVAAAEERAAAAEAKLEERAAAANAAAAAAATEVASRSGPSGWLELLASGEFDPLGEVEVLSAVSEAAVVARAPAESLDDAVEKAAWLKSLDVPLWGKAAMTLSEAASEAAGMAELAAMCNAGDEISCRILQEQQDDKISQWLDKLNVPDWGAAAAVLSVAASDAATVSANALEELETYGFLKKRGKKDIPNRPRGGSPPDEDDETE
jgi:hypothetical protein